jgi:hypothetical protein
MSESATREGRRATGEERLMEEGGGSEGEEGMSAGVEGEEGNVQGNVEGAEGRREEEDDDDDKE